MLETLVSFIIKTTMKRMNPIREYNKKGEDIIKIHKLFLMFLQYKDQIDRLNNYPSFLLIEDLNERNISLVFGEYLVNYTVEHIYVTFSEDPIVICLCCLLWDDYMKILLQTVYLHLNKCCSSQVTSNISENRADVIFNFPDHEEKFSVKLVSPYFAVKNKFSKVYVIDDQDFKSSIINRI